VFDLDMEYLHVVLMVALLAAFIILLADKTKLIEYAQVHGSELISKLFHCKYCLAFWLALIISLPVSIYYLDYRFLFIPLFSTPITRMLV